MMQALPDDLWRHPKPFATFLPMSPRRSALSSTESVAERLVWTRDALDLKQATLARVAGLTPQQWNNYESGRERISVDSAIKLCIAFGLSLDWIYRGEMRSLSLELAEKIQRIMTAQKEPTTARRRP